MRQALALPRGWGWIHLAAVDANLVVSSTERRLLCAAAHACGATLVLIPAVQAEVKDNFLRLEREYWESTGRIVTPSVQDIEDWIQDNFFEGSLYGQILDPVVPDVAPIRTARNILRFLHPGEAALRRRRRQRVTERLSEEGLTMLAEGIGTRAPFMITKNVNTIPHRKVNAALRANGLRDHAFLLRLATALRLLARLADDPDKEICRWVLAASFPNSEVDKEEIDLAAVRRGHDGFARSMEAVRLGPLAVRSRRAYSRMSPEEERRFVYEVREDLPVEQRKSEDRRTLRESPRYDFQAPQDSLEERRRRRREAMEKAAERAIRDRENGNGGKS